MERYLDHALWQSVLDFIGMLAQATYREQQHYERDGYSITAFLLLARCTTR